MRSRELRRRGRALAMIGLCAVVVALVPGSVSAVPGAHTYFVSPSGDDTANGWSKKTAWRTLSRVAQQRFIAGDRLLLEGGAVVYPGSIVLDPSNSAGDFEIGSYGGGRAIIDAGDHSGIVIKNLSDIKISSLVIRGDGGTTDNDDLLARKNGNLQMFANTYRFASEPLPFSWNETQYSSIADWQTETGLDPDRHRAVRAAKRAGAAQDPTADTRYFRAPDPRLRGQPAAVDIRGHGGDGRVRVA